MQTSRTGAAVPTASRTTPGSLATSRALDLMEARGGSVRAGAVAKRLGVPPAVVDQLRLTGRLLGVRGQHGYVYPVWQFDGRSFLSGLSSVLDALRDVDAAQCIVFLLTPQSPLHGTCPLDALGAGAQADVVRLAHAYAAEAVMEQANRRPAPRRA